MQVYCFVTRVKVAVVGTDLNNLGHALRSRLTMETKILLIYKQTIQIEKLQIMLKISSV